MLMLVVVVNVDVGEVDSGGSGGSEVVSSWWEGGGERCDGGNFSKVAVRLF